MGSLPSYTDLYIPQEDINVIPMSPHKNGQNPRAFTHFELHENWYLVSLTIRSYTFLYLVTVNAFFSPSKDVTFYNLQTTDSTFVGTKWDAL